MIRTRMKATDGEELVVLTAMTDEDVEELERLR
jgi:hypothetical protein